MTTPIFKLSPGIQSYSWGKKGSASLAAQLGSTSVPNFNIDQEKAYAELWMGTHPTLPSKLASTSTLLSDHLKDHSQLIGEKVLKKFPDSRDGALPFLFKVLSIGTALSIQAHPDKSLAERLFTQRGDVYKDPNHKPEMAIALTPFLAFLNFLPLPTLLLNLLTIPELSPLIPSQLISNLATSLSLPSSPTDPTLFKPSTAAPDEVQKKALKAIFAALMSAPDDIVKSQIGALIQRYQSGSGIRDNERELVDLTLMLDSQYSGDVGVLCVFFLNVVELNPGEAAFLGANVPHAYIKGDIIECMATSDNVVRAGLTPKLRDVPTLIEMLTYEAGPGSKQLLKPSPFPPSTSNNSVKTPLTTLYNPPIEEFSVLRIQLPNRGTTTHRAVEGPSLCIVTGGSGGVAVNDDLTELKRGDVIFLGAGMEVEWKAGSEGLEVFRAFVEA